MFQMFQLSELIGFEDWTGRMAWRKKTLKRMRIQHEFNQGRPAVPQFEWFVEPLDAVFPEWVLLEERQVYPKKRTGHEVEPQYPHELTPAPRLSADH